MKTKLKIIIIGILFPILIYGQTSNNKNQEVYNQKMSDARFSINYSTKNLVDSYIKSLENGFSESLLNEQIQYCNRLQQACEMLNEGTELALQDSALEPKIKGLYQKIDSTNTVSQSAFSSYKMNAEEMKQLKCFTENSNCDFDNKRHNLEASLTNIIAAQNTIDFNYSLSYKLSELLTSSFKNQTLEEIFNPKEKLRIFTNEGNQVCFYDALFPEENFTFKWSGYFTEKNGKNLLQGSGVLEYINNGYSVITYKGNLVDGRLMDQEGTISYTNFIGPVVNSDNKYAVQLNFWISTFFYNKPIGVFSINSKFGEYEGEYENYIPHGKGILTNSNYNCEGEFKGGYPYTVDCDPVYGSDKKPVKLVNGKEQ
ncbi:hypothetical protein EC396_09060 [Lutibacter sp. HS1-25]|uniref:hypothetical protein n=1 Tax=Lutibacter sp. HS1-25 TaxID=2485000 RepID=UPI0010118236|nr:hypothetical protein [Lutibacter sp. HS1-25]RXP54524.1 hypothetical protein EC396_09060 [Lutibacter sp. HS1-25]